MFSDRISLVSDILGRVFLTGKVHVEYRRVLNTLFTRKALR
jgi:cytochrome P450